MESLLEENRKFHKRKSANCLLSLFQKVSPSFLILLVSCNYRRYNADESFESAGCNARKSCPWYPAVKRSPEVSKAVGGVLRARAETRTETGKVRKDEF